MKLVIGLRRKLKPEHPAKREKGFTLIEVVVALAIFSLLGVAILTSMQTASRTLIKTDGKETARNIAETQMEYVKGLGWQDAYTPYTPTPAPVDFSHFATTIAVTSVPSRDASMQKITVTVTGQGGPYVLEDYKVNEAMMGH
jgi:prepilin-type N-terminal cleavage/methylation domain-containing protein